MSFNMKEKLKKSIITIMIIGGIFSMFAVCSNAANNTSNNNVLSNSNNLNSTNTNITNENTITNESNVKEVNANANEVNTNGNEVNSNQNEQVAEENNENENDKGIAMIAAALSTGLACLGAGIAVAMVASSAVGAISENPKLLGKTIIFAGLAEGIAIYGLIISIMILNQA